MARFGSCDAVAEVARVNFEAIISGSLSLGNARRKGGSQPGTWMLKRGHGHLDRVAQRQVDGNCGLTRKQGKSAWAERAKLKSSKNSGINQNKQQGRIRWNEAVPKAGFGVCPGKVGLSASRTTLESFNIKAVIP